MQTEFEAKYLDQDHSALRKKLQSIGAKCNAENRLMRRKTFDFPNDHFNKIAGWIRVRDEGDKVTLAYKQLKNRKVDGTIEVSIVVDDFAKACSLLEAIGFEQKSYQETKRESWQYENVQIELDEWPWIKPFIELEGPNEASIKNLSKRLGLNWSEALHGSVENAYQAEYDVTEREVDYWPEIKFDAVPDWLKTKRKA